MKIFAYVGMQTYNPRANVIPARSRPFRAVDYVLKQVRFEQGCLSTWCKITFWNKERFGTDHVVKSPR